MVLLNLVMPNLTNASNQQLPDQIHDQEHSFNFNFHNLALFINFIDQSFVL